MGNIEKILSRDGKLAYTIRGVSMLPMLRQKKDIVLIAVPKGRLKKYDVALYKRGGQYVLHRVIKVIPEGYLIRGDNTYDLENVPEEAVIGVLQAFAREGKTITVEDAQYKRYVRLWCAIYPLRLCYVRMRRMAGRLARRLGIRRPGAKDIA